MVRNIEDNEAQRANRAMVLDMLDRDLTVYWISQPVSGVPGTKAGDYLIPRQKAEGYAPRDLPPVLVPVCPS